MGDEVGGEEGGGEAAEGGQGGGGEGKVKCVGRARDGGRQESEHRRRQGRGGQGRRGRLCVSRTEGG